MMTNPAPCLQGPPSVPRPQPTTPIPTPLPSPSSQRHLPPLPSPSSQHHPPPQPGHGHGGHGGHASPSHSIPGAAAGQAHRTGSGNRIDFPTIACKICGDRSSGVHYGIISCEGCKAFFRRCLKRVKDGHREYACVRGGHCQIRWQQRSGCPACRYKKCVELGMSIEAVRIGRIPNKQKETEFADIQPYVIEAVKTSEADQSTMLEADPETQQLIDTVVRAHRDTAKFYVSPGCPEFDDFLQGRRLPKPEKDSRFSEWNADIDLNSMDGVQMWCSVVTQSLAQYIKRIVTFCKQIPGFGLLDQQDQMVLVKAGFFEILTVQDSIELVLYHSFVLNNEIIVSRGNMLKFMPQDLVDALYDFAERLHRLRLTMTEVALLSAVVLYADDRENLVSREAIGRMQAKLLSALKVEVQRNHRSDPHMFAKVLLRLPELRTVDNLHNQFIMKLKVGSTELPMPELYKEVYDLPGTPPFGCTNGSTDPPKPKPSAVTARSMMHKGLMEAADQLLGEATAAAAANTSSKP